MRNVKSSSPALRGREAERRHGPVFRVQEGDGGGFDGVNVGDIAFKLASVGSSGSHCSINLTRYVDNRNPLRIASGSTHLNRLENRRFFKATASIA